MNVVTMLFPKRSDLAVTGCKCAIDTAIAFARLVVTSGFHYPALPVRCAESGMTNRFAETVCHC
jgi:hypothetical protein